MIKMHVLHCLPTNRLSLNVKELIRLIGCKTQDMMDEWGLGMNGDEWGLTFTHSSPLGMNGDEWGMNGR